MVKKTLSSLLVGCFLASAAASAKEPVNLYLVKQRLVRYHDSGEYLFDIDDVMKQALRYLSFRIDHPATLQGKKPLIILDIDETSLSNYPSMVAMDFGGTKEEIRQAEDEATDLPINPTLQLYRYAKSHNVSVIFLTGRHEYERAVTIKNLSEAGYANWDGLILRSEAYKTTPAATYKTDMRKQLVSKGYDIILNIGDQRSDLAGGFADKTFKLPNPYYFIP